MCVEGVEGGAGFEAGGVKVLKSTSVCVLKPCSVCVFFCVFFSFSFLCFFPVMKRQCLKVHRAVCFVFVLLFFVC